MAQVREMEAGIMGVAFMRKRDKKEETYELSPYYQYLMS